VSEAENSPKTCTNRVPTAFLSYSSADRPKATEIATRLNANGVRVWFDEWEIRPGDSLRRKIEAGIAGAEFFMVLLTSHSLRSEWVQTELDAGLVRSIEGTCTLVPLLAGVEVAALSSFLRSKCCQPVADMDRAVEDLVLLCHGGSKAPPLGPAPTWTRSPEVKGLSPEASAIAVYLCRESKLGRESDPVVDPAQLRSALGLSTPALLDGVVELEDAGLIILDRATNCEEFGGLNHVATTAVLFLELDPIVHGWSAADDGAGVAAALLTTPDAGARELRDALGWSTRRFNPACRWLIDNDHVMGSEAVDAEFESIWLFATDRTRLFVRRTQRPQARPTSAE
jgi:hypothetical protein